MPGTPQSPPAPQSLTQSADAARIALLAEAQARFDRVAAAALERRLAS